MSWELRPGGKAFLYRTVNRRRTYTRQYLGHGLAALLAAADWQAERVQAAARKATVAALAGYTRELLAAARTTRDRAMTSAGHSRHHRGWRLRASARPVAAEAVADVGLLAAACSRAAAELKRLAAPRRVVQRAEARGQMVESIHTKLTRLSGLPAEPGPPTP